jgi:hypothetical protein
LQKEEKKGATHIEVETVESMVLDADGSFSFGHVFNCDAHMD